MMSFKILTAIFLFIAIGGIEATNYAPNPGNVFTYGSGGPWDPPNWSGMCNDKTTLQNPFKDDKSTGQNPLPKIKFFGGIHTEPEEIRVTNNGYGVYFKFVYHYLNAPKIYSGPLSSDLYQFDSFSYHIIREHSASEFNVESGLELQFLHFNLKYETLEEAIDEPDGIAVIAVRYKVNMALTASQFPDSLVSLVGSVYNPHTTVVQSKGTFTYAQALGFTELDTVDHYNSKGSLTTPPCYESVQWFVVEQLRDVYASDLIRLNNILVWDGSGYSKLITNNRPLQDRNGRDIWRYS